MYTNRLGFYLDGAREGPEDTDYWMVRGVFGFFFVSAQTARRLSAQMSRLWPPRSIRFRDLSGSEVCVPTRSIELVVESTAAQRAHDRRLRRAVEREENEKNENRWPWEDQS